MKAILRICFSRFFWPWGSPGGQIQTSKSELGPTLKGSIGALERLQFLKHRTPNPYHFESTQLSFLTILKAQDSQSLPF